MKNRLVISSLIIGLVGATAGLASAQTDSRDSSSTSGSSSDRMSSDPASSSSGSMRSGSESGTSGSGVGQYIDDATVTTRVKSRFAQDDRVSAMNIGVETTNGVVQLSGFAGSEAEKERAAEIAGQVPDVRSVQNNITIQREGERGSMGGSSSPGSGTGSGSGSSGMGAGSAGGDTGRRY